MRDEYFENGYIVRRGLGICPLSMRWCRVRRISSCIEGPPMLSFAPRFV